MELPLLERVMAGDDAFHLTASDRKAEQQLVQLCGYGSNTSLPPPPGPGEQYRFHFDMTKCIGCKCCVVACNEQNGNPADILWRRVGEIEGGTYPNTIRSYLSMGCNHCLEPTCMTGCPVDAYSKDGPTGIVRHSADICIGCQYCTWNCSYGVPQYNPERGVVGKCDMCYGRLTQGQSPACAASCPEGAIRIEVVQTAAWRQQYRTDANSPGMPSADDSLSTTRITLPAGIPRDVRKVDLNRLRPEHPHWPLVVMTVLTQLSVGAFTSIWLMQILGAHLHPVAALVALMIATLALGASTLHLGRPIHAVRALKMWRRSWLSREVLMFTLFANAATAYSIALWLTLPGELGPLPLAHLAAILGGITVLCGLAGVGASARLYLAPGRPAWNSPFTLIEFYLTAILLGSAGANILSGASATTQTAVIVAGVATILAAGIKFIWLARCAAHERRGAFILLFSVLSNLLMLRILLLSSGLLLVPFALNPWTALPVALLLIAGEFVSRYLFFVSVVPSNIATEYLCGGSMNLLNWILRKCGVDILSAKYSYGNDPVLGFTSTRKHAERWVKSTCGYCSVGCGMELGVRDGKVVSVRGDPDHPVNLGKLCPKGLSEHYALDAEDRAKYPLLRVNGKQSRVSWEEALTAIVDRFGAVQCKYGNQSVGVISTGQLLTEEFYALGKLVQLGFGTSNYDGNTTLCMSTAVAGYKRSFGSDGPPGAYADLETADVIFLIGANLADNHPILCTRLEENKGKTMIVADPRVTKTAMMADVYLPLKPRSDLALLNAMLRIIIDEELFDKSYVERHTAGFEELRASLAAYTLEYAAQITGLAPELIRKTALLYAHARAAFIGWTMGVNHSTKGTETVNAINNLALITGNIGRSGASPFSITGQCNAMGTREAGFASSLPGYRKFESEADRTELARLWKIPVDRIPSKRGLAYPDIIEAAVAGKIRALWIIGTNPLVSFPNIDVLKQALSNLDFLVVQDGFHPTPTTELADLVLPAAIWGEKEGCYTNSERRSSKANAAVAPPGEARSDFNIFLAVAEQLGLRDELFPGWKEPADAFEEWRHVSAGRLCDYSGMSYGAIESSGGIQWPYPQGSGKDPSLPRRLYSDGIFQTEDGRAKLIPTSWEPFPEQPSKEYPLILNTGRTVEHWHTRTKTGGIDILQRLSPRAWLEMNPVDAKDLGLRPHDRVEVVSPRGRVSKVELRITEIVAPGQVFLPFHFVESNANQITQSAFDPISREPNFKQCSVRIERSALHAKRTT